MILFNSPARGGLILALVLAVAFVVTGAQARTHTLHVPENRILDLETHTDDTSARVSLLSTQDSASNDMEVINRFRMKLVRADRYLKSWNANGSSTPDICRGWEGIRCNAEGRITHLSLMPSSPIKGYIIPEIGLLSELVFLNLSGNALAGSIPIEIGQLSKLEELHLSYNLLTGPIPPQLANCASLRILHLELNFLSGPIPPQLGFLKHLQQLYLLGNELTGPLPPELLSLSQLRQLEFSSNRLSGPLYPDFIPLSQLVYLALASNNFSGNIPESIGKLPYLALLALDSNELEGPIPAPLIHGLAKNVTTLGLSGNKLTGLIPPAICTLLNIFILDLSHNLLSGPIPECINLLNSTLSALYLNSNNLSGPIPPSMGNLNLLVDLYLDNNQLTGPIPTTISCAAGFQNLQLSAHDNQLSGTIPEDLAGCTYNLTLQNNKFSSYIPPLFAEASFIQYLNLENNKLSGPVPHFFNCSALMYINLRGNSLTGPIPSHLTSCQNLITIDLGANFLTGPIPPGFCQSTPHLLSSLALDHNRLNGSLNPSLANCLKLGSLELQGNNLIGPLPPTFGHLSALLLLDLSHNQISGPIPGTLGNLSLLQTLSMGDNELTGPLDPYLGHLPALTNLDLSDNELTGDIPYALSQNLTHLTSLNVSNNQFGGTIPPYFTKYPLSSFVGNLPSLCGSPLSACPKTIYLSHSLGVGAIVGMVVGILVALGVLGLVLWYFTRSRRRFRAGELILFQKFDFPLTIQDILDGTDNFGEKAKLGRGGFGTVYKAVLQDGTILAVKRLAEGSQQGEREFLAEVQTLGKLRHRNLVKLVGSYVSPEDNEKLLIYQYLPGGSLDNILEKEIEKGSPMSSWKMRLHLMMDTARGLKYLHHDASPPIIHRDMKPANILLDEEWNAYVADFGLAREVDVTKSHMSTAVFGTIGYLAPEYSQFGRLTQAADVFAFGIILLQMLTGKLPTDEEVADRGLARWVGGHAALAVIDKRMDVGGKIGQALSVLKLGLLCTARVASSRPTMAEVLHVLENLDKFGEGGRGSTLSSPGY